MQRVSTLLHFVADPEAALKVSGKPEPLRLTGLTKLTELNEKRYSDLPVSLQFAFMKRMLRVTALSDKSDPEVRFDMFERLNNGGIALTPQEVRACIYRGKFMDLVEELSADESFLSLIKLQSNNEDDGTKEELVLKTFAYLLNRDHFNGKVKDFLNTFTREVGPKLDLAELRTMFTGIVAELARVVGGPILRKNVGWTPQNQAEAVLVAAAELYNENVARFTPKKDWLNDAELVFYSTKGTNTRNMLTGRIERAKRLLRGAAVKSQFNPDPAIRA